MLISLHMESVLKRTKACKIQENQKITKAINNLPPLKIKNKKQKLIKLNLSPWLLLLTPTIVFSAKFKISKINVISLKAPL